MALRRLRGGSEGDLGEEGLEFCVVPVSTFALFLFSLLLVFLWRVFVWRVLLLVRLIPPRCCTDQFPVITLTPCAKRMNTMTNAP